MGYSGVLVCSVLVRHWLLEGGQEGALVAEVQDSCARRSQVAIAPEIGLFERLPSRAVGFRDGHREPRGSAEELGHRLFKLVMGEESSDWHPTCNPGRDHQ